MEKLFASPVRILFCILLSLSSIELQAGPDETETPCFLRGIYAGPDDYVCTGQWAIVHAYTENNLTNGTYVYDSVVWTSSGTGMFFNKYALYTSYGPGAADIAAGTVTLTITMYSKMNTAGTVCDPVSDQLIIYIGNQNDYYTDLDHDGYGTTLTLSACNAPLGWGYAAAPGDCDDTNWNVHPFAGEICDHIDNNCNGETDEGLFMTYYYDGDGDGHGSEFNSIYACSQPEDYTLPGDDCDDLNALVFPGAQEFCDLIDNNCDNEIDEGELNYMVYYDNDHDGYGSESGFITCLPPAAGTSMNHLDCDDANPLAFPSDDPFGKCDEYNGFDDDCDGGIDEDGAIAWYEDQDFDGYGDPLSTPVYSNCVEIENRVMNNADCDDSNPEKNPSTEEMCNGMDDNCNGTIDEDIAIEWHADIDQDGYGNFAITAFSCTYPDPAIFIYGHWVTNNTDCFDEDASAHPGAPELCDGVDNNCNGQVDIGINYFYRDTDGDYFGDESTAECTVNHRFEEGWIMDFDMNGFDCNDTNDLVNEWAAEICDQIDNNCDGNIDEGTSAAVYYSDNDQDGFGNASDTGTFSCVIIEGMSTNQSDCNDWNENIHPEATELCSGIDENCNGIIDEGFSYVNYYLDADADGYGDAGFVIAWCATMPGFVMNSHDCNDANAAIHPGAVDICDGINNDCDSETDENGVTAFITAPANDLCGRQKIKLTATEYNAAWSYQWYRNNIAIAGATGKTYNAKSTGNYKVKITKNKNGCYGNSAVFAITKSCREAEDTLNTNVNIYPNPATEHIVIDMSCNSESGSAFIEMYDLTGRLVYSHVAEISHYECTAEIQFDETFTTSFYIVRILIGDEIIERRLIVVQ